MEVAGVPPAKDQLQEVGLFWLLSEKLMQPGKQTEVAEAVIRATGGAQGLTVTTTAAVLVHPFASVTVTVYVVVVDAVVVVAAQVVQERFVAGDQA